VVRARKGVLTFNIREESPLPRIKEKEGGKGRRATVFLHICKRGGGDSARTAKEKRGAQNFWKKGFAPKPFVEIS